jgi:hypothetical protein
MRNLLSSCDTSACWRRRSAHPSAASRSRRRRAGCPGARPQRWRPAATGRRRPRRAPPTARAPCARPCQRPAPGHMHNIYETQEHELPACQRRPLPDWHARHQFQLDRLSGAQSGALSHACWVPDESPAALLRYVPFVSSHWSSQARPHRAARTGEPGLTLRGRGQGRAGPHRHTRAAARCQTGSISAMPPAPCTSGSITSAHSRAARPPAAPAASCLQSARGVGCRQGPLRGWAACRAQAWHARRRESCAAMRPASHQVRKRRAIGHVGRQLLER